MTYRKFCVDNPLCMRRFHLAYDDEQPKQTSTKIRCPHCDIEVFKADDHPSVRMLREENLTKVSVLNNDSMHKCDFKDRFA